jgi:hypothetical protein
MTATNPTTTTRNFVRALNSKFDGEYYVAATGAKYDKIAHTLSNGQHVVYAFVERDTDRLLKPASWSKASGTSNYNLRTEFDLAVYAADAHGGFLYAGADEQPRKEFAASQVDAGSQKCTGACGQTLPMVKFPTTAKGGRGTECRKDRDARRAAAKA